MNCPNCGYDEIKAGICPNCRIDTVIFMKTSKASYELYNRALSQAKENNLSGAIGNLNKSLEFNKANFVARNLLGLVLFETGHIGDALKHWIISNSMTKDNNQAKDYIEKWQKDAGDLERYNEAIVMYNQALIYVKQKSDDMAIIQLKKALEYNPKFIDAMNLLSFCYLLQNNKEKAKLLLEKVLSIDTQNPIAQNYYKDITGTMHKTESVQKASTTSRPHVSEQRPTYTRLAEKEKKSFGNTFHLAEIICFMLGGLCGVAILYILIMPSIVENKDNELKNLSSKLSVAEQRVVELEDEYQTNMERLQVENSKLSQEMETLNTEVQEYAKIRTAQQALELYASGDAVEAAEKLGAIDVLTLPADIAKTIEDTKPKANKAAANTLYTQGLQQYNSRDYENSQSSFEKFRLFAESTDSHLDDAVYYLGRIAEANGDDETAVQYYQEVLDDFSSSNQYYNARNRRNALTR